MLEYVIFLKVVLLILIYKTYTKCLMYSRQKLACGSRKDFKEITTTSINPFPSRTPLAKHLKYIESLLHLFFATFTAFVISHTGANPQYL